MSIVFISLAIITSLFLIVLLIRRYREKLEHNAIMPFVDIMTIVIGIMSVITSAVSISVMKSQEKMQETLLQLQKEEHQPIFLVKESMVDYGYENLIIENVGEQMLAPADITFKSYIEVQYSNAFENIDRKVYYNVIYHPWITSHDNVRGVIWKTNKDENFQNHLNFVELTKAANRYNSESEGEYVCIDLVNYLSVSYIDVYGDKNVKYYRDNQLITREEYERVYDLAYSTFGEHHTKSIDKVELNDLIVPLRAQ